MFAGGKEMGGDCTLVRRTLNELDINGDGIKDRIDADYCHGVGDPPKFARISLRDNAGKEHCLTRYVSEDPRRHVFRSGFDPGSYNVDVTDFYVQSADSKCQTRLPQCSSAKYFIGRSVGLPDERGGGMARIYRLAWDVDLSGKILASWAYYVTGDGTMSIDLPVPLASLRPSGVREEDENWEAKMEEIVALIHAEYRTELSERDQIEWPHRCRQHPLSEAGLERLGKIEARLAEINATLSTAAKGLVEEAVSDQFGRELLWDLVRLEFELPEPAPTFARR